MNSNLIATLRYGFSNAASTYYSSPSNVDAEEDSKLALMKVPISGDVFEIPIIAFNTYIEKIIQCPVSNKDINEIIICLNHTGVMSHYKTLDASIKEILNINYKDIRLIKLPLLSSTIQYYATNGAIFDKEFNPVLMLSWEIKKDADINKYRFSRPILRIAPEVVIYKSNALERYIVNKILTNTLEINSLSTPNIGQNNIIEHENYKLFKPKVVIEKIPFVITRACTPTINTTNEQLLKIALDNIEEVIQ